MSTERGQIARATLRRAGKHASVPARQVGMLKPSAGDVALSLHSSEPSAQTWLSSGHAPAGLSASGFRERPPMQRFQSRAPESRALS
eukprot:15034575-Alexandrium_andersonii.AAC.1